MVIELKNFQVETIVKALNYPMSLKDGRIRNRFLNLLKEPAATLESGRIEILNSLSQKEEDGSPKMKMVEGKNSFDLGEGEAYFEALKKFNEEYLVLQNEKFVLEISDILKPEVKRVQEFINDTTIELDAREVNILEDVIVSLDGVKEGPGISEPAAETPAEEAAKAE